VIKNIHVFNKTISPDPKNIKIYLRYVKIYKETLIELDNLFIKIKNFRLND